MRNYKLPVFYVLLTVATGALMGMEALLPLALGLSLFIPALCYVVTRDFGILAALFLSVVSIGIISLSEGWKTSLDISAFSLLGISTRILKERLKTENIILVLSLISFGTTILEDLFIGLPAEVKQIPWFTQLRWGFYFLSSVVISAISVGMIALVSKEDFGFKRLKFDFWIVPIFLISGFLSILRWIPEIQVISANVLVGVLGLFIVQGFAIFSYYIEKFSLVAKILTLFAIVFFPAGAVIVAVLAGIFDFWFDFRKLKGGKKNGSDSA